MLIEPTVTVPGELNLDSTVLVAMDFAVSRVGDHGRLIAEHAWLFWPQRWAKSNVPRRRQKGIAIALEIIRAVAGGRLFQHLRLPATVFDFGDQPQVIPRLTRVFGEV